ncbi:hypothetical protein ADK49_34240 [Streptomyces sp. WM6349]|nr:hypothetical protein ADK49_34240 [Streptomyces sp. WM6349]
MAASAVRGGAGRMRDLLRAVAAAVPLDPFSAPGPVALMGRTAGSCEAGSGVRPSRGPGGAACPDRGRGRPTPVLAQPVRPWGVLLQGHDTPTLLNMLNNG